MTVLVQQRTPSDCGVCCLAMVTGRAYEDVLAAIGDVYHPERGLGSRDVALGRLGFRCHDDIEASDYLRIFRQSAISPEFFLTLAWGRRAIICVQSLNLPGAKHLVYFDGQELFDPSTRLTYRRFQDLRPEELVLFREGKPNL